MKRVGFDQLWDTIFSGLALAKGYIHCFLLELLRC
jgi:hypothetical protein